MVRVVALCWPLLNPSINASSDWHGSQLEGGAGCAREQEATALTCPMHDNEAHSVTLLVQAVQLIIATAYC